MNFIMKKIGFLTLALALFYSIGHAQTGKAFYKTPYKSRNSGSYSKSTGILTLSYGVPNESLSGYSHRGNNRIGFGPAYVKYEHGIVDEIGLGGELAIAGGRYDYSGDQHEKVLVLHMAFMGYYHFNKLIPVPQLDVYAGSGIAVRNRAIRYSDNTYSNYTDTDVTLAFKVGARYYLKNNFGFYGEAGFDDMSDINLGVSFRF